jgi:hypothetical protein
MPSKPLLTKYRVGWMTQQKTELGYTSVLDNMLPASYQDMKVSISA